MSNKLAPSMMQGHIEILCSRITERAVKSSLSQNDWLVFAEFYPHTTQMAVYIRPAIKDDKILDVVWRRDIYINPKLSFVQGYEEIFTNLHEAIKVIDQVIAGVFAVEKVD